MAKITYIAPDGTPNAVEVEAGLSIMEGALDNDISGIVAECGGCCSCATCHIYVDESWVGRLPERDQIESEMLECTAAERREHSRLSCQIEVTDEMDGLVVYLPEIQF